MEKELQKLMKMYQQAECDHDLNMGVDITVRQSRQSGVARATCPD